MLVVEALAQIVILTEHRAVAFVRNDMCVTVVL